MGEASTEMPHSVGVQVSIESKKTRPRVAQALLDLRLFIAVSLILVMLAVLFVFGILVQLQGYEAGIAEAVKGTPVDHAAILTYNRGLGAAIVKTSALFLGYLLVFTGALYVLRNTTSPYGLKTKVEGAEGTLHSNSPGLVIVTLGVVLVTIAILTKSDLNYDAPTVQYVPAEGQTPAAVVTESVTARQNPPTAVPPSAKRK